jgi:hypothetical protein
MQRATSSPETLEAAVEVEAVVSQLRPARQRRAVLHLLHRPGFRRCPELGVVGKDVAEIGRVVAAVVFDHAGGLDDLHQLGVDFGRVEPLPVNVVQTPVTGGHRNAS